MTKAERALLRNMMGDLKGILDEPYEPAEDFFESMCGQCEYWLRENQQSMFGICSNEHYQTYGAVKSIDSGVQCKGFQQKGSS